MNDVVLAFEKLQVALREEGQLKTLSSGVSTGFGDIVLGIDAQGRQLFAVPTETAPPSAIWSGQSLDVDITKNPTGSAAPRALIVRCLSDRMLDQFHYLTNDVLSAVQARSDEDPGRVAAHEVDRWRALFLADQVSLLTTPQLAGLFGELDTLLRLASEGRAGALQLWQGWDRRRHDFQLNANAVEVKTTMSVGSLSVEINGLWQLAAPEGGSLFLVILRLEEQSAGRSVPNIIQALTEVGVDEHELLSRVQEVGYYAVHGPKYANHCFVEIERGLYRVAGDFPRLSPDTVTTDTSALDDVTYRIALAGQQKCASGSIPHELELLL